MGMQKLNRMPKDAFHYPRYAIPQFDDTTAALPTTFYWCSIVSIGLSRTIFKINGKICTHKISTPIHSMPHSWGSAGIL